VRDLEAAKMDLVFAELYAALAEFITASVNKIAEPGYTQALRGAAERFAATARSCIEGEAGASFKAKTARKPLDPALAADRAAAYLAAVSHEGAWPEKSMASAYAAGYAALALLRPVLGKGASGAEAARLACHWQFPRKLAEYWESLGVERGEARHTAELAAAVLARTAPEPDPEAAKTRARSSSKRSGDFNPGSLGASIIAGDYETEDFRRLLGINRFDDVTWFNKEAFEKAVGAARFFLLPENAEAFGLKGPDTAGKRRERSERINSAADCLLRAETVSGYRLDALLEALSAQKPAPGKTAAAKQKTPDKRA
jgi:hypothetical protein